MNISKEIENTGRSSEKKITLQVDEKMDIQRGDIVYVAPPYNYGHDRVMNFGYAVVCSNNSNNLFSPVLEVVFVSKKKRLKTLPTHFWIMLDDMTYVVHCEQVMSVERDRIERIKGRLSETDLKKLKRCLTISLGL